MARNTPSNIYQEEMMQACCGFPVWQASPENGKTPVAVGDFGFMLDGRFVLIFNAIHGVGPKGTPDDFPKLDSPPEETPHSVNFKWRDVMSTRALKELSLAFDVKGPVIPVTGHIEVKVTAKSGAALAFQNGRTRINTNFEDKFKNYMKGCYDSVFKFAQSHGFGRNLKLEDLILVTGCDLTSDYAMLAFRETQAVDLSIGLNTSGPSPDMPSAGANLGMHWRVDSIVHQNHGPSQSHDPQDRSRKALDNGPPLTAGGNDNISDRTCCVFVRGWRIKTRPWKRAQRLRGGAATPPKKLNVESDEEWSGSSSSSVELEDISEIPPYEDPANKLFDYIFANCADAKLAMVHDNHLVMVMQLGDPNDEGIGFAVMLDKIRPPVILDHGVANVDLSGKEKSLLLDSSPSLSERFVSKTWDVLLPRPAKASSRSYDARFATSNSTSASGGAQVAKDSIGGASALSRGEDVNPTTLPDNSSRLPSPSHADVITPAMRRPPQAISTTISSVLPSQREAAPPIPQIVADKIRELEMRSLNIEDVVEKLSAAVQTLKNLPAGTMQFPKLKNRVQKHLLHNVNAEWDTEGSHHGSPRKRPALQIEDEVMRSALPAVKTLSGREFVGSNMEVDQAEPEERDQVEKEVPSPNDWTDAALHIENLSPRVTEYMLREILGVVGAIRQTQIIRGSGDQLNSNHAIVDYEDERDTWIALQTLNGRPIFDTRIWVKLAAPVARLDAVAQNHYVLVENLSTDVNDDALKDAFCDFQSLSDAHVTWVRNPNWPGGEGVLAFSNKSDAEKAIATMNGKQLGSSAMVVSWAQTSTKPATQGSVPTILAPNHSIALRRQEAAYLQSDGLASNFYVTVQDNIALIPQVSVDALVDTLHKRLFSRSPGEMQRRLLVKLLVRLCHGCQRLPSTVTVSGVRLLSQHHVAGGEYADIYQGQLGKTRVALKRHRTFFSKNRDHIRERVCKEVIGWCALNHPNVMPFLGLDDQTFHPSLCMVSPWMRNGNMLQYAIKEELSPHRLNQLLVQAADGLDYLHEQSVIHGSLRCANVFVNDAGEACLSGFAQATLLSDSGTATPTEDQEDQGSHRWNAPEVYAETFTHFTKATDIYALGCVCLELHTRKHPFPHLSHDVAVITTILRGGKPRIPSEYDYPGAQNMWMTVEKCWDADPKQRPAVYFVRGALQSCV